jgi:hypothetical protein
MPILFLNIKCTVNNRIMDLKIEGLEKISANFVFIGFGFGVIGGVGDWNGAVLECFGDFEIDRGCAASLVFFGN